MRRKKPLISVVGDGLILSQNPARYRVMIHDDTYYVFDRDKYTFC